MISFIIINNAPLELQTRPRCSREDCGRFDLICAPVFIKTGSSRIIVIFKVNETLFDGAVAALPQTNSTEDLTQISQNVAGKDSPSLFKVVNYSYSCSKSLWCSMELLTAVKLAWLLLKIGSCMSSELSISCFIHYESLSTT